MTTQPTPGFVSTHERDRLAAAAPDLLAELKDALRVLENVWPPETRSSGIKRQLDAMRAAIAKATGEA